MCAVVGKPKHILAERAERHTIGPLCEVARHFVRAFHLRVDLIPGLLVCHHPFAKQRKETSSDAEPHVVIGVLHDEQDRHVMCPAWQYHAFAKSIGWVTDPAREI